MLGSFLFRCVVGGNGKLRKLDADAVSSRFDDDGIVLDGDDVADDAADGRDVVADLQGITHLLGFFFALVFRADHKEVEHRDQNDEHENHGRAAAGGGRTGCRL